MIQVKKPNNDQPREVPMADWLFETLWAWREQRLKDGFVFANAKDKKIKSLKTAIRVDLKRPV